MIKKILVALDPDSDTPIATRYAVEIAQRYQSTITGLAVVDMGHIEADTRGGGIGSMYFAEKLRDRLTTETRDVAQELLKNFEGAMKDTGIEFGEVVEEGVPFQRIVEDMKYHDLLIVGRDPHFFYSHPKEKTDTLARVVKGMIAPTLVVGDRYQPINRVLVTYDASDASVRAMRSFCLYSPFGHDIEVEIFHVLKKGDEAESELMLEHARSYLATYGFNGQTKLVVGNDINKEIIERARTHKSDLIVAGAHSVSKIRKVAFGSTTSALLKDCPIPLFLDH